MTQSVFGDFFAADFFCNWMMASYKGTNRACVCVLRFLLLTCAWI